MNMPGTDQLVGREGERERVVGYETTAGAWPGKKGAV